MTFGSPFPSNGCQKPVAAGPISWANPSSRVRKTPSYAKFYDSSIWPEDLNVAAEITRRADFHFDVKGPYLVEVFLLRSDDGQSSYWLEADGLAVDNRHRVRPGPRRLAPRRRYRPISLVAMVEGPTEIRVRTDGEPFLLSALRWTPREEYERLLVPKWRRRARHLHECALFEVDGHHPTDRRHRLHQIHERLYLSHDPVVRQEAVVGLARVWYWLAAENRRPPDIARTEEVFREALAIAPEHPLVRQTISTSCSALNVGAAQEMPKGDFCDRVVAVPWEVVIPDPPDGAPDWAVAQRRLAHRMEAITEWWVEQRQNTNGELGGGWGDDVEILRQWGPQALGLGSEVAARGIRALADGLWRSDILKDGYNQSVSDVEHSSEPTTDTLPLRAALDPDDSEALARLRATAACAENWIAEQPDGFFRFRGSWFNCRSVDSKPERAVDVHLNVRAMGPALWHAYLSRDPKIISLLEKWAASWVRAMHGANHGKPAGVIPSAVRSETGSYMIDSDRWDKPNAEWDYFQWSGRSQEALTSLLLAVHDLTSDEQWIEAARESFRIMAQCDTHPELCEQIRGAPGAFFEWRRRTGDGRYDEAFGYRHEADDQTKLATMAELASASERRLAHNFDMFTSEVLYTDRVYYPFPPQLQQLLFGGEAPRGERYPAFAVTWLPAKEDFARAVLTAEKDNVRLRLYSFEEKDHEAAVRLWRLKPGAYHWQALDTEGEAVAAGETRIMTLPRVLRLPVPPGKEVTIQVSRTSD